MPGGTCFDWISPVLAILGNIARGPSTVFLVDMSCGYTGREVITYLRQYGVETWGHMIVNNYLTISVHESQADTARQLLAAAGLA